MFFLYTIFLCKDCIVYIYIKLIIQDNRSKKLNFNPDGKKHYVYRIIDYTRTEKQHYYGSHTPKKEGCQIIKEDYINISLLHSEDNGYLEITNKISKT